MKKVTLYQSLDGSLHNSKKKALYQDKFLLILDKLAKENPRWEKRLSCKGFKQVLLQDVKDIYELLQ